MMGDTFLNIFGLAIIIPLEFKQLLIAGLIGLLIGFERELRGKAASLRTFSTISMGSCLFTILSVQAAHTSDGFFDITRISAQIVTGIGFLGGGVIFRTKDRVEGITTGAMIWLSAALGMACGFNQIPVVLAALIVGITMHAISYILYSTFFDKFKPLKEHDRNYEKDE